MGLELIIKPINRDSIDCPLEQCQFVQGSNQSFSIDGLGKK